MSWREIFKYSTLSTVKELLKLFLKCLLYVLLIFYHLSELNAMQERVYRTLGTPEKFISNII